MCSVLLPPGVNPIAVKKYIKEFLSSDERQNFERSRSKHAGRYMWRLPQPVSYTTGPVLSVFLKPVFLTTWRQPTPTPNTSVHCLISSLRPEDVVWIVRRNMTASGTAQPLAYIRSYPSGANKNLGIGRPSDESEEWYKAVTIYVWWLP